MGNSDQNISNSITSKAPDFSGFRKEFTGPTTHYNISVLGSTDPNSDACFLEITSPSKFGKFVSSANKNAVSNEQANNNTLGSSIAKYRPTNSSDTEVKNGQRNNISTRQQCITFMKEYENSSLEEIRFEDYSANRKKIKPFDFGVKPFGNNSPIFESKAESFGEMSKTVVAKPTFGSTSTSSSTIFGSNPFGATTNTFVATDANKPVIAANTKNIGAKFDFGTASTFNGTAFGANPFGATTNTFVATDTNKPVFGASTKNPGAEPAFGSGAIFKSSSFRTTPNTFLSTDKNKPVFGETTKDIEAKFDFGSAPTFNCTLFGPKSTFGSASSSNSTAIGANPFGATTNTFVAADANKPVFGATIKNNVAGPAFGSANSTVFGGKSTFRSAPTSNNTVSESNPFGVNSNTSVATDANKPVFGATTKNIVAEPAFGSASNSNSTVFGAKPTNNTVSEAVPFGVTSNTSVATDANKPVFGATTKNNVAEPAFGSASTSNNTVSEAIQFGVTSNTSVVTDANKPVFGATTKNNLAEPAFGSASNSNSTVFGAKPTNNTVSEAVPFGVTSNTSVATDANKPVFGATTKNIVAEPAFGSASNSNSTVFGAKPTNNTVSEAVPFGVTSNTSVATDANKPVFGATTKNNVAEPAFGSANSTVFGAKSTFGSASTSNNTVYEAIQFGVTSNTSVVTDANKPVFGATTKNNLAEPAFGSASNSNSTVFGAKPTNNTVSEAVPFGVTSNTSVATDANKPVFGATTKNNVAEPAFGSASTSNNTVSEAIQFGENSNTSVVTDANKPVFGATTKNNLAEPAFGSASNSNSTVFGAKPTNNTVSEAVPFGVTSNTSVATDANKPVFGATTKNNVAEPAFGSASNSNSTVFGAKPTNNSVSEAIQFGVTSNTSVVNDANKPVFGATTKNNAAEPAFGSANSTVFGSKSTFGSASTSNNTVSEAIQFGVTSNTYVATDANKPVFGPTTKNNLAEPAFGSASNSNSTVFGAKPTNNSVSEAIQFGVTSNTSVVNDANKPVFGATTKNNAAEPAFESANSTVFGSKSTFGSASTSNNTVSEAIQFGVTSNTSVVNDANKPVFGATTKNNAAEPAFGSANSTVFGSKSTFGSASTSNNTVSEAIQFGVTSNTSVATDANKPVFGATTKNNLAEPAFGSASNSNSTVFGAKPTNNSVSEAIQFGVTSNTSVANDANKPVFGATTKNNAAEPAFGSANSTVFGSKSTFGSASTSNNTVSEAIQFGVTSNTSVVNDANKPVFGATTKNNAAEPAFGSANSTVFGSKSTFGSASTSNNTVSEAIQFGVTSNTSVATDANKPVFGATTKNNLAEPAFGSASNSNSTVFGAKPTNNSVSEAIQFGVTSNTSVANDANKPVFGATTKNNAAEPAFGSANSTVFGSKSTFGSASTSNTTVSEAIQFGVTSNTSVVNDANKPVFGATTKNNAAEPAFGTANSTVFGSKSTFGSASTSNNTVSEAIQFGVTSNTYVATDANKPVFGATTKNNLAEPAFGSASNSNSTVFGAKPTNNSVSEAIQFGVTSNTSVANDANKPVFGATTKNNAAEPAFGSANSTVFGSKSTFGSASTSNNTVSEAIQFGVTSNTSVVTDANKPVFGATTKNNLAEPAFGSASNSNSTVFGAKPTNNTVSEAVPFGVTSNTSVATDANKPVFGATTKNIVAAFGSASNSNSTVFGAKPTNNTVSEAVPFRVTSNTSVATDANKPVFGATTKNNVAEPAFGSASNSNSTVFGAKPTFGSALSSNNTIFGADPFGATTNTFAATDPNKPVFGSTSNSTAFGPSPFTPSGGNKSVFCSKPFYGEISKPIIGDTRILLKANKNGFKTKQAIPTKFSFCSPSTAEKTGSFIVKYQPTNSTDTMVKNGRQFNITTAQHCITFMKEYENTSLEEIRFKDYSTNRKVVKTFEAEITNPVGSGTAFKSSESTNRHGAKPKQIVAAPKYSNSTSVSMIICQVCMENFTASCDTYVTICGHIFHNKCLTRWIERGDASCPSCRHPCRHSSGKHKVYLQFDPEYETKESYEIDVQKSNLKSDDEIDLEIAKAEILKLREENETLHKIIALTDEELKEKREIIYAMNSTMADLEEAGVKCNQSQLPRGSNNSEAQSLDEIQMEVSRLKSDLKRLRKESFIRNKCIIKTQQKLEDDEATLKDYVISLALNGDLCLGWDDIYSIELKEPRTPCDDSGLIFVTFKTFEKKQEFLALKKDLPKTLNVMEALDKITFSLYNCAKTLKRYGYKSVYHHMGNVYVKKNCDDAPILIESFDHIKNLKYECKSDDLSTRFRNCSFLE